MRFFQALLACIVPIASARSPEQGKTNNNSVLVPDEEFLVEIAPGQTQWVTLEDKWILGRHGQRFMDITTTQDLGTVTVATKEPVQYPYKCVHNAKVKRLGKHLSKRRMKRNLHTLTSFHNRYYNSEHGRQSSEWVLKKLRDIIKKSGVKRNRVTAESFHHPWTQSSVIATIQGESNNTIVLGTHQDSINLWQPMLAAPGADDGGSGTVTLLEVFRALLKSTNVRAGMAINTVEFHWYSGEEGGLLGSQAIFKEYAKQQRDVKAMLQQDKTGYVKGTFDAGVTEVFAVVVDYIDIGLTKFVTRVIEQYSSMPWLETRCGYACSDHVSASKAGYPSAFLMESLFENSNRLIHNSSDLVENLSFTHMKEYAKITLGFVYELAFYKFRN